MAKIDQKFRIQLPRKLGEAIGWEALQEINFRVDRIDNEFVIIIKSKQDDRKKTIFD